MRTLLAILLLSGLPSSPLAWHSCGGDGDGDGGGGGGVCPDGNKCCPVKTTTTSEDGGSFVGDVAAGSRTSSSSPTYYCISGDDETQGSCCGGGRSDGVATGCGEWFECAVSSSSDEDDDAGTGGDGGNYQYCRRTDFGKTSSEKIPPSVTAAPRYRLCHLPEEALKQVHGLQVSSSEDDDYYDENPDMEAPQLAYLSTSGALDGSDPGVLERQSLVETVVVMVHGSNRNVDDYLCTTSAALPREEDWEVGSQHAGPSPKAMVVAPWFLADIDGDVTLHNRSETVEPVRWSEEGPIWHTWRYGADSDNLKGFSSYDAADALVERIVGDVVRFPNLRRVVVAGHSAGGQYVQRWALLSNSWAFDGKSQIARHQRSEPVSIRAVVANPKSYCFLDDRRYDVNGTFQVPPAEDVAECPDYDQWEWGLGEDNGRNFLPTPYKDHALAVAGGKDRVVSRYAGRDVVYIAGANDFLPNGNCMAQMQGPFRRARSRNFFASLREIYGRNVHRRLVVANVYHNHGLMFQSPEGYQALFGLMGTSATPAEVVEETS